MDTMPETAITPAERRTRIDWSRWSGPAFLLLLIVAAATGLGGPTPYTDGPAEYAEYYGEDHPETSAAVLAGGLAAVFFVWMIARIMAGTNRGSSLARRAIAVAGSVFIVALLAAIAASAALSNAVNTVEGFEADPQTAIAVHMLADGLFQAALLAAAALCWAVAVAASQSGYLTGWMAWAGFVLIPLVAFAWALFMIPALLFFIWLVAVSMIVPRRPADSRS